MKTKLFLVASALVLLIASCNKCDVTDIDGTGVLTDATLYFPLKQGSYWIYQRSSVMNDTVYYTEALDSMYIAGDSILNGNIYTKIMNPPNPFNTPFMLWRDSSGYLVNEKGRIYFSVNNFTDTLYKRVSMDDPTYPIWSYIMQHKDSIIEVPAGTFPTYDYCGYHHATPLYDSLHSGSPRLWHYFYAPSAGIVKIVYFYAAPPGFLEVKLLRFHIEQ